jgi:hypothetical protein
MEEILTFKMDGPVFKDGIPLDIAIEGLEKIQSIIDKAYLEVTSGRRVGRRTREQFRLRFSEMREGSFEADLQFCVATVALAQTTFPFLMNADPKTIWNLTKQAFAFLEQIMKARAKGEKPQYSNTSDGNVVVVTGDNNRVIVSPVVINIARESLEDYQSLAKLNDSGVAAISCGEKGSPAVIRLDEGNRKAFLPPSEIVPEPVNMDCEIFDFNKFARKGKLKVPDGQLVPAGEYSFEVVGDQAIAEYIESMLKTQVNVSCLKEVATSPFGAQDIAKIQLLRFNRSA